MCQLGSLWFKVWQGFSGVEAELGETCLCRLFWIMEVIVRGKFSLWQGWTSLFRMEWRYHLSFKEPVFSASGVHSELPLVEGRARTLGSVVWKSNTKLSTRLVSLGSYLPGFQIIVVLLHPPMAMSLSECPWWLSLIMASVSLNHYHTQMASFRLIISESPYLQTHILRYRSQCVFWGNSLLGAVDPQTQNFL